VSDLKSGWNKLRPEHINDSEGTETVRVFINSETLTSQEVTNWLECDKQDGSIDILNDDQIIT